MTASATGHLQVYTGEGKGKTTAALGATWRALGAGLRVCFVQFLKGGIISSEEQFAARCPGDLRFLHLAHPFSEALMAGRPSEEDRRFAQETWTLALSALSDSGFDLVVLDEVNNALRLGLLSIPEVLAALRARPPAQEVICTGRGAPAELLDLADLVTKMHPVKHPFDQGHPARRGIEY